MCLPRRWTALLGEHVPEKELFLGKDGFGSQYSLCVLKEAGWLRGRCSAGPVDGGGGRPQVGSFGTLQAPEKVDRAEKEAKGPTKPSPSYSSNYYASAFSTEKVKGKLKFLDNFLWLAIAPLSVAEVPTLATRWQAQFTEIYKVTLFFFLS